jgi:hypothetical protein
MVAAWLAPCAIRDCPSAAAERFYLEFEVGRRGAAITTFARATAGYFQPFIAGKLLDRINKLQPRFRRDNYLHYNLTKRFAPGLELLPFESMRWGFEWNEPTDEADRAAWLARAPIPYTPQTYGAWPMYGAVGSDCWQRFFDELFCYEDGENVWSFLDRGALLTAFRSDAIFSSQLSSLFWNVYGLSIMMTGDWLNPPEVPESLVFARYEKPWAEIYSELCKEIAAAEGSTLDLLTEGIAEYVSRSGEQAPAGRIEQRCLLVMGADSLALARQSAGRGFRLQATTHERDEGSLWRIVVESEARAQPANSYLVLPLADIEQPRRSTNIIVKFRYRADNPSEGRCYLARYDHNGRKNLAGSVLNYGPEWQTAEHVFALAPAENIKRLDFLLGLPDRAAVAEIDSLTIDLAPRASAPRPRLHARAVESEVIARLRATVQKIATRYGLRPSDVENLSHRAGLDERVLSPSSPYELARFESWVTEVCGREPTAAAVAARLARSRDHWALLRRCIGLSDQVRVRLFQGAPGMGSDE